MKITRREFIDVCSRVILGVSLGIAGANIPTPNIKAEEKPTLECAPPPQGLDQALDDILKRFFNGDREMFRKHVEEVRLERVLYEQAVASPVEREWYDKDAADKAFFLVNTLGNSTMGVKPGLHAVCYQAGEYTIEGDEPFLDNVIDERIADIIKKIYQPSTYIPGFVWNPQYDAQKLKSVKEMNDLLSTDKGLRLSDASMRSVYESLEKAGNNRQEFLKGLALLSREHEHRDEKMSAALWYIANMRQLGFLIHNKQREFIPDLHVMGAAVFYENIKYAVDARHRWPWAQKVSWQDFLFDVVPARFAQEPLKPWRRCVYHALTPALDALAAQHAQTYDVLQFLNKVAQAIFRFVPTRPEDKGHPLLLAAHKGRCEDETTFLLELTAAAGLDAFAISAVRANANNNHQWAGALTTTLLSIMPCEPHPTEDPKREMDRVFGKVYATSPFGRQRDITHYFGPTTDLEFAVAGTETYYLNIFNWGRTVTVASATPKDGKLLFPNVGTKTGVLYTVSSNLQQWAPSKVQEVIGPFLVDENGVMKQLDGGRYFKGNPALFTLTNEVDEPLERGGEYHVMCWVEGAWKEVQRVTPKQDERGNGMISGIELYQNRLYHLFEEGARFGDGDALRSYGKPFMTLDGSTTIRRLYQSKK